MGNNVNRLGGYDQVLVQIQDEIRKTFRFKSEFVEQSQRILIQARTSFLDKLKTKRSSDVTKKISKRKKLKKRTNEDLAFVGVHVR